MGQRLKRIVMAAALLATWVVSQGCGVKTPPVAPGQPPMPRIDNLSGVVESAAMILTWTHPAGHPQVSGYIVLQLRVDTDESPCPDCSPQFEQIGSVALSPGRPSEPQGLRYVQPLQSGFHYTFKVQPFQASGARGPDSNPVAAQTGDPS
jgi:hypothetical protein